MAPACPQPRDLTADAAFALEHARLRQTDTNANNRSLTKISLANPIKAVDREGQQRQDLERREEEAKMLVKVRERGETIEMLQRNCGRL